MLPRIIGQGRAAELLFTRPQHERRGGRALGLLQPPRRTGARPRSWRTRLAVRRPDVRARDDQDDARPGVGHEPPRRDRGRGPGAGDLHADEATSSAPTARSWRKSGRCSRVIEISRRSSRTGTASSRRALPEVPEDLPLDDRCRALVHALAENGWLDHCVGDPLDVRTLCLARETARLPRRAGRLRVRHAGARVRGDQPVRERRAEAAPRRPWRAASGSPPSRSRSPRPGPTSPPCSTTPRTAASPAPRPGSPTAGSPASTPSSPARRRASRRISSTRTTSGRSRSAST